MRCVFVTTEEKFHEKRYQCVLCKGTTVFTCCNPANMYRRCLKDGLGDRLHKLLRLLKLEACDGCQRRREMLNRWHAAFYRFIYRGH